ncbi:hypothetical protein [Paenibacillus sp. BR1-192]|uniref:hypothetical protein n=1 Tax=Paenibacillus sp. BR1-192 TaxID=3032287 RepID=UPI00240CF157|nr:hypothetical protein [Paenibacillus sp. BR1-192]WFB58558.1 hypothetical protein P0X86_32365 [Paenibacillus sp. BR1-192]
MSMRFLPSRVILIIIYLEIATVLSNADKELSFGSMANLNQLMHVLCWSRCIGRLDESGE